LCQPSQSLIFVLAIRGHIWISFNKTWFTLWMTVRYNLYT
jgi:hypothetical protein